MPSFVHLASRLTLRFVCEKAFCICHLNKSSRANKTFSLGHTTQVSGSVVAKSSISHTKLAMRSLVCKDNNASIEEIYSL